MELKLGFFESLGFLAKAAKISFYKKKGAAVFLELTK